MTNDQFRALLMLFVGLVGLCALFWGSAMLVGGFRAAGLLDNEWNPIANALVWFAAIAIMGANALFYQCLLSRKRSVLGALLGQVVCVVLLIGISTTLQVYVTQRSANGENLLRAKQVAVHAQGAEASRIDRDMFAEFESRLGVIERRMHYEEHENGGKGPNYRAAKAEFDRLSERYSGTLGRTRPLALQGRNVSEDAAAIRSFLSYLHEKSRIYERFAEEVGVLATDYTARIDKVETGLSVVKADSFIDEKSVIYLDVLDKLNDMFRTGGAADVAFTMAFMVSIAPDICQLLSALLLVSLRPKERPDDHDGDGTWGADWSPFDRVWGETHTDTVN